MKLKKIVIHNYRQHRSVERSLEGSLIGITAPNGKGKSNFIGAIQFALTGEQPPFKKADLISWGEDDGWVDLDFEDNNVLYHIHRCIKKPVTELSFSGQTVSGSTKVAEVLDGLFNIDKELFKQVVFVRQQELDSILFTEPRQRELAFQKLMGIGDADRVYKALGEVLTQYGQADFDEQIETQEGKLNEAKDAILASVEAIKELHQSLDSMPSADETQKAINDATNRVASLKQLLVIYDRLDQNRTKLSEVEEVPENAKYVGIDIEGAKGIIRDTQSIINSTLLYRKLEVQLKEQFDKLEDLNKQLVPQEEIEKLAENARKAEEAYNIAKGKALTLKSFSVPKGVTTCPLCGSHTDKDLSEDLAARILALDVSGHKNISDLAKQTYNKQLTNNMSVNQMINSILSQIKVLENQLQNFDPHVDYTNVDIDALNNKIASYQRLVDEVTAYTTARQKYLTSVSHLQKAIDDDSALLNGITREAINSDIEETQKSCDNLWKTLDARRELDISLAKYEGEVKGTNTLIIELEKYISDLKESKRLQDEVQKRVAVVQNVRNWFHYSNGPRTVSTAIMERLNADVNKFLGNFTAPFVVEPMQEGVGFKVRFTDGRPMPKELPDASVLSGGQKVQLAVAFRLATYCTFANKLGLLVLDEPTAYLDDANIECFGDLMVKVAQIARNMSVQVLIATHEKAIMENFDTTIEL